MPENIARWVGIDITTTEMAVAVGNSDAEAFSSTAMQGATLWKNNSECPAFDLAMIAPLLRDLLDELRAQNWSFDQPGALSVACRQHDMVVLDASGTPLMPALSWQCNAAIDQVEEMIGNAFLVESVGRVEPRFILPKLAFVIETDSGLANQISRVMTTGDWVLGKLCSSYRLSTSDALSNGLLQQADRELAKDVMRSLGMDPDWFPSVAQSGEEIGEVSVLDEEGPWSEIRERLRGWKVIAGLGDNHASALGCGMRDNRTLVVSAGTSGTINIACPAGSALNSVEAPSARFEFYRANTLLLRMLAFCGDWYNRFLREYCAGSEDGHDSLNEAASQADLSQLQRVPCDETGEKYPDGWNDLPTPIQVASVQYSICLELLIHVQSLLEEVPAARVSLQTYVLTGGLSQSPFFQQVFAAGIAVLDPAKAVRVSGRTGPLRYKTSASGAMLNARMPEWNSDLQNMPDELFPLRDCGTSPQSSAAELEKRLRRDLTV